MLGFLFLISKFCVRRHRVAAWSVEAGDKARCDRVAADPEDDRNHGGGGLSCECPGGAAKHGNHENLSANEIGTTSGSRL
jgi:hypothetical protein